MATSGAIGGPRSAACHWAFVEMYPVEEDNARAEAEMRHPPAIHDFPAACG
jgi:hypothetical protein